MAIFHLHYFLNERNITIMYSQSQPEPENGGHVHLTKDWATMRMGCKAEFLEQVKTIVMLEEILSELILDLDRMGLSIVPGCQWTLEQKGWHE